MDQVFHAPLTAFHCLIPDLWHTQCPLAMRSNPKGLASIFSNGFTGVRWSLDGWRLSEQSWRSGPPQPLLSKVFIGVRVWVCVGFWAVYLQGPAWITGVKLIEECNQVLRKLQCTFPSAVLSETHQETKQESQGRLLAVNHCSLICQLSNTGLLDCPGAAPSLIIISASDWPNVHNTTGKWTDFKNRVAQCEADALY